MATIVSVHSFRGETGKSNTTANVAAVLAARGRRVGVIDTDIQSPGIHILFGLMGDRIVHGPPTGPDLPVRCRPLPVLERLREGFAA